MISDQEFAAHNSYSLKHYGQICRCPDCGDHREYEEELMHSTYGSLAGDVESFDTCDEASGA